jgi:hypothetical protein
MSITIRDIRDDIINPNIRSSSTLLKTKVLAHSLDVPEFKRWIEYELNGYQGQGAKVPDYRTAPGANHGQFSGYGGASINNRGLPVSLLPPRVRELYGKLELREGMAAIDTTIDSLTQSNQFEVHAPRAAEAVLMLSEFGRIIDGYTLVAAWQVISKNILEGVRNTVRNRLLTFVLELESQFPEVAESEVATSKVPKVQAQNIFNTYVLGGQNVLASGTGFTQQAQTTVQRNDIDSLLAFISTLNVAGEDVEELREAVLEGEPPSEPGKFGSRVASWVGKMTQKSLEGAWMTGTNQGVQALIGAISRYYGLN